MLKTIKFAFGIFIGISLCLIADPAMAGPEVDKKIGRSLAPIEKVFGDLTDNLQGTVYTSLTGSLPKLMIVLFVMTTLYSAQN